MFGGIEVVDGADASYGRPCMQARLEGSPPAVHQEQLNTAAAAALRVHRQKRAVKRIHARNQPLRTGRVVGREGGGLQRHRHKLYRVE